jgi:hypothetical protein
MDRSERPRVEKFFWLIIEGESLKATNDIMAKDGLVKKQECED